MTTPAEDMTRLLCAAEVTRTVFDHIQDSRYKDHQPESDEKFADALLEKQLATLAKFYPDSDPEIVTVQRGSITEMKNLLTAHRGEFRHTTNMAQRLDKLIASIDALLNP